MERYASILLFILFFIQVLFKYYFIQVLFLLNNISKRGNIPSSFFECREE